MRRMDGSSIRIAIYEIRHSNYAQESQRKAGDNRAEFVMRV